MNKKILMSGVSILSALALVGGGAFALFTSTASNNGNTFGAGNMQLRINGAAGSASTTLFTVSNIAPGQQQTQVITLSNTGSVASSATKLASIAHGTSTTPDLGDKLTLDLYDDVNNDGVLNGGDLLRGSAHITDPAWNNIDLGFGLAASGGSHNVIAQITFDGTADDTFQGTNSNFNLNFQTNQ